ncbi:antirestriction family protein [Clostridioides difficile CD160]|nr:antirestriction family protein [Clostridioides difficile CD160]
MKTINNKRFNNEEMEIIDALLEGKFIDSNAIHVKSFDDLKGDNSIIRVDKDTSKSNEENLAISYIKEVYNLDFLQVEDLDLYFDLKKFAKDFKFKSIDLADKYIEENGGFYELDMEVISKYFDYTAFGEDILFRGTYISSNNIAVIPIFEMED